MVPTGLGDKVQRALEVEIISQQGPGFDAPAGSGVAVVARRPKTRSGPCRKLRGGDFMTELTK